MPNKIRKGKGNGCRLSNEHFLSQQTSTDQPNESANAHSDWGTIAWRAEVDPTLTKWNIETNTEAPA